MKRLSVLMMVACLFAIFAESTWSQGRGRQARVQSDGEHGRDDRHDDDREVFQYLLQHHQKINRTVKELPHGVETLTQSEVPEIADKIKMVHEHTEKGVKVTETSDDPYVAKLIQAHAIVVSGFVERGFAEAMKNHTVASDKPSEKIEPALPVISGHGAVVHLPEAAMQPRNGAKLIVDITRGGEPAELNGALEKVAKYLNIYAGGGAEPATVDIALVFHGDATLTVLNADAYAKRFDTEGNPNLSLLRELHHADVEMYVCGQSLISKGSTPNEVAVFVETAVSALTAVVNLQADGYAYLPLGK